MDGPFPLLCCSSVGIMPKLIFRSWNSHPDFFGLKLTWYIFFLRFLYIDILLSFYWKLGFIYTSIYLHMYMDTHIHIYTMLWGLNFCIWQTLSFHWGAYTTHILWLLISLRFPDGHLLCLFICLFSFFSCLLFNWLPFIILVFLFTAVFTIFWKV